MIYTASKTRRGKTTHLFTLDGPAPRNIDVNNVHANIPHHIRISSTGQPDNNFSILIDTCMANRLARDILRTIKRIKEDSK